MVVRLGFTQGRRQQCHITAVHDSRLNLVVAARYQAVPVRFSNQQCRRRALSRVSKPRDDQIIPIWRLNNLGQLLKATNRLAEAEPLMRCALAIVEVSLEERLEF